MKRILFSCCIFMLINCKAQQTPWSTLDFPFAPFSFGTLNFSGPGEVFTPFYTNSITFNQDNKANVSAGDRVHLQDGFHAGDYTGNGYFHAFIQDPDFDVVFIEPNEHIPNVGQFEKLEMGMKLPASVEQQVNDFIANSSTGINPFDPEQISVEAQFQNGSSNYTVYGFYYENFTRDPSALIPYTSANWIPEPTDYHWRVRFAPPIVGPWHCTISVRFWNSATYSYSVNNIVFNCVPSSNPGFLKKGNDDWHLAFSGTQQSFFALGQNIAWSDPIFRGGPDPAFPNFTRLFKGGILDNLDFISNLADNGGNMTRIVSAPWSFELEWEQLGNYEARMNRAWEQDQMFDLCEQKNMKLFYCLEMQLKFENLFNSDPNDGWENNPYNLEIQGVDHPNDYLTNSEARKKFKNKLRYFISRWGYSTSLGVFQILSEMDAWDYFPPFRFEDYPPFQLLQFEWHNEMLQYVKSLLSYRPILTSTSHQHPGRDYLLTPFSSPFIDITGNHAYQNHRKGNIERLHEFSNSSLELGTHFLWPNKPTIFDEMGMHIDSNFDIGDIEGCNDVSFHNSLWASAFMGGFGTGFNWYQWSNNDFRHDNYRAINVFFNGIDFQNTTFNDPRFWDDAPFYDINPNTAHHLSTIETYYINDDHGKRSMGWIHNATNYWGNLDQNCFDRFNNSVVLPSDDDTPSTPQPIPIHTKYEIHGLNNGEYYNLELYMTRFAGGLYQTSTWQVNFFGTLKPEYEVGLNDWAFKAYLSGNIFRLNNEITYDTLHCWEDTVYAEGNHKNDTLGRFHYHWNFGNGQISDERNTIAIYNQPGTYLGTLIISDSLGWTDTLRQYIVKLPPCNLSSRMFSPNALESNSTWNAFPNPASTFINFTFDSTWSSEISIELYSLEGKCVLRKKISFPSNENLPIAELPAGVYLLRVTDQIRSDIKRIILL